jgi:glycosyltransferase involved in cell wall biosynthesis
LLYHGIDLGRFPPPAERRPARDGNDPDQPVVLLSVGRAVAKKGYDVLLEALVRLPLDLAWSFVHVGDGPILGALRRRAKTLGLSARITWSGARPHQEVLGAYRAADLFVLASRIAEDGDRDGLPNVLMEAQSQGLACISTAVSGIPELIAHGATGVLVPPDDPAALAGAIEQLIRSPDRRASLGSAGMRIVYDRFSFEGAIDRLAERFGVRTSHGQTCESRSTRQ